MFTVHNKNILFTQSTVVLHEYSIALKLFYLLEFCPEVAQNSLKIPGVLHVQRNSRVFKVFQVFEVCGHPVTAFCGF